MMTRFVQLFAITASLALAAVFAPAQRSFKDELDLGVQAYKAAKYEEAIQHFQNATSLNPQKAVAHLYLATLMGSNTFLESKHQKTFIWRQPPFRSIRRC